MFIWIPVDGTDDINSKIVSQFEAKKWALVNFENGRAKSVDFYDKREDSEEAWVEFAILINKYENYIDLMNEGIMVLCVREEETIEEIVSAFAFKELDEIGL
ncbi:hypothetical protein MNB_SV-5-992 [hydrothermal vent metagenome]|uniref:Uncharacterized protein n=1 Tax=hydrothermal vent metagenome TaxID=652676 RepID=A0A1W1EGD3_9ZZZZ